MRRGTGQALALGLAASLPAFYLLNRAALAAEGLPGNILEKASTALDRLLPAIRASPLLLGTSRACLLSGLAGAGAVWLAFLYHAAAWRNPMRGAEHGTARWGGPGDIRPLTDPVPDMNIPLSATEQISVRKARTFEADRNKNIIVVGGSGSGKTFSEIKPSLMQLHSSYVVTDPKGQILVEVGKLLKRGAPKMRTKLGKDGKPLKDKRGNVISEVVRKNGKIVYEPYEIKVLNTIDFKKSMHYNPFAYIKSEKDILKFVTALISKMIREASALRQSESAKAGKKQLAKNEKRIAELDLLFRKTYEDYAAGRLTEKRFEQLSQGYESEQGELEQQTAKLKAELAQFESDTLRSDSFLELAKKYSEFSELTPLFSMNL
jgi:hypothetical protein